MFPYPTTKGWQWYERHSTWLNVTAHDRTSRHMIERHGTWLNVTEHDQTSRHMIERHSTWLNVTAHDGTSQHMIEIKWRKAFFRLVWKYDKFDNALDRYLANRITCHAAYSHKTPMSTLPQMILTWILKSAVLQPMPKTVATQSYPLPPLKLKIANSIASHNPDTTTLDLQNYMCDEACASNGLLFWWYDWCCVNQQP